MNAATRERLTKRLNALEQRRQPEPVTVEWHIVEPAEHGPRDTGERWAMDRDGARQIRRPDNLRTPELATAQTRPADLR